jgi:3-methyl-2-oxobutanoate hydroxymethyltransferase
VPVVLVGDSLGQVMLGYANTLPVTLEETLAATRAVVRGAPQSLVVADMPFLTYQTGPRDAVFHAGQLLKFGLAQAVKCEGGEAMAPVIRAMVEAGIPVMGHVGLQPQSIHQLGGYARQGETEAQATAIRRDALAVQAAGAFAIVAEKITAGLAAQLSHELHVPVIGCGSGPECDAQVLVTHDLLGMFLDYKPSFVEPYADLAQQAIAAVQAYQQDIIAPDAAQPRKPTV